MTAFHPIPGAIIYVATKFAVQGFNEALAEEMRQDGYGDCIHLTSIHPYFVSTRKDLMEATNLRWNVLLIVGFVIKLVDLFLIFFRFPAITADETAEATVNGILTNQRVVSIPQMNRYLAAFCRILPLTNQHLVRDYILREKESKMFCNPDPAKSFWVALN